VSQVNASSREGETLRGQTAREETIVGAAELVAAADEILVRTYSGPLPLRRFLSLNVCACVCVCICICVYAAELVAAANRILVRTYSGPLSLRKCRLYICMCVCACIYIYVCVSIYIRSY